MIHYGSIGQAIDLKFIYKLKEERQVSFGLAMAIESNEFAYTYEQSVSVYQILINKMNLISLPIKFYGLSVKSVADLNISCMFKYVLSV